MSIRKRSSRPHGRRYPWAAWINGRPVVLVRGVDFDCEPASMGILARLTARRLGRLVRVRVSGDTVTIEPADDAAGR